VKLSPATVGQVQGLPRTIRMEGPLGRTCPACQSPPGHPCYRVPAPGTEQLYPRRLKRIHNERRGPLGRESLLGKSFLELKHSGTAPPGHGFD